MKYCDSRKANPYFKMYMTENAFNGQIIAYFCAFFTSEVDTQLRVTKSLSWVFSLPGRMPEICPSQWWATQWTGFAFSFPLAPNSIFNIAKLCQSDKCKMLYHYLNSPFMHNGKIVTFIFGHSCFLFCESPIYIFAMSEMVLWLFFLLICGMNFESIALHKCITNIFCQSMTPFTFFCCLFFFFVA